MYLEVEENPNCEGTPLQAFSALSPPRPVEKMWLDRGGKRHLFWVTGIDPGGKTCSAYAQKVQDSGSGVSFLIYGGSWGIRFKPAEQETKPWNLTDPDQWGEPYKFYGDERDLVYGETT